MAVDSWACRQSVFCLQVHAGAKLMGQYHRKWPISLIYVSKPLLNEVTVIGEVEHDVNVKRQEEISDLPRYRGEMPITLSFEMSAWQWRGDHTNIFVIYCFWFNYNSYFQYFFLLRRRWIFFRQCCVLTTRGMVLSSSAFGSGSHAQ